MCFDAGIKISLKCLLQARFYDDTEEVNITLFPLGCDTVLTYVPQEGLILYRLYALVKLSLYSDRARPTVLTTSAFRTGYPVPAMRKVSDVL
jgi:hypothetical protein